MILWISLVGILLLSLAICFFLKKKYTNKINKITEEYEDKIKLLNIEHDRRLARLRREMDLHKQRCHLPLVKDLLPIFDALEHAVNNPQHSQNSEEALTSGLQIIISEILNVLKKHNIRPIHTKIGDEFDPNIHEAIGFVQTPHLSEDMVGHVLRSGWLHHDDVIRPAMVQINKVPEESSSSHTSSKLNPPPSSLQRR